MIDNVTDQLDIYACEVADAVTRIESNYGFTRSQALKVVEIASNNIKAEVMHHYATDGLIVKA